jgi:uncharacterized protein YjiS (DUF1127 family)
MKTTELCLASHFALQASLINAPTLKLPDMERAMTTTTMTSFRSQGLSSWERVMRRLGEWQRRSRSRQELESLSDATLRDIGITRCDVHREANKPFWMA